MPEDFIEVPESGIDAPIADTASDDEEDVVGIAADLDSFEINTLKSKLEQFLL